ncbi:hypothetical protein BIY24_08795 [Halobacteriovorax marinus]|nr:hypothetical protein BIY24_08795 [Halobacteriovorax marinus]
MDFARAMTMTSFNIRNLEVNSPYSTDPIVLKKILSKNISDLNGFQEIVDTGFFKNFIHSNFKDHDVITSKCGGYGNQKLSFVYNKKKFQHIRTEEDLAITGKNSCKSGVRPLLKINLKDLTSKKKFWVYLVHLKAGSNSKDIQFRDTQLKYLKSQLSSKNAYVIMGDFNTTQYFHSEGNYFHKFIRDAKLIASSSEIDCSSYWWGGVNDGLYYPSLLDHILVTKELVGNFNRIDFTNTEHCAQNTCQIASLQELGQSYNSVSDHCPIRAELR